MQDRPSAIELLDAIATFLRERSEASEERWLRFQFQVAANSLGIIRRELEQEEGALEAEWQRLNALLPAEERPAGTGALARRTREREEALCNAIRSGAYDGPDAEAALLQYLWPTTREKVGITYPQELAY